MIAENFFPIQNKGVEERKLSKMLVEDIGGKGDEKEAKIEEKNVKRKRRQKKQDK